jgi:hypothetical protein
MLFIKPFKRRNLLRNGVGDMDIRINGDASSRTSKRYLEILIRSIENCIALEKKLKNNA